MKNVGSIPVTLHVVGDVAGGSPRFSDLAGASIPDVGPLAQNATHDYAGGLQWTELGMDDLGRAMSVTYTITAAG